MSVASAYVSTAPAGTFAVTWAAGPTAVMREPSTATAPSSMVPRSLAVTTRAARM